MSPLDEVLTPSIIEICASVMALEVTGEPPAEEAVGDAAYAGCVHLAAEPQAAVVFECAEPLARLMAARMFDVATAELTDADVCDAIGELTNMAAGYLKAVLDRPSALSLPTVTRGGALRTVLPHSARVARCGFACGADRFHVSVFEGIAEAA
jgi:CheY-specific phosphatase CheX